MKVLQNEKIPPQAYRQESHWCPSLCIQSAKNSVGCCLNCFFLSNCTLSSDLKIWPLSLCQCALQVKLIAVPSSLSLQHQKWFSGVCTLYIRTPFFPVHIKDRSHLLASWINTTEFYYSPYHGACIVQLTTSVNKLKSRTWHTVCCIVRKMLYISVWETWVLWVFFYSQTNEMHQFIKFILFYSSTLHVSDGLSIHHQESKLYIQHQVNVKQILVTAC